MEVIEGVNGKHVHISLAALAGIPIYKRQRGRKI
jgi:hypothetical protein